MATIADINSICLRCKKIACVFYNNRKSKYCRECNNLLQRLKYKNLSKSKKKKRLNKFKIYREKNKEKRKFLFNKWKEKNSERYNYLIKKWNKNNKHKMILYHKKYRNNRYKTDIDFKLRQCLSSKMSRFLKNKSTSSYIKKYLDCSLDEFKQYIENKFSKGMSWENYQKNGWHLDHIKPCASFDFSKIEQIKQCFHYTNYQPLWRFDNQSKGSLHDGVRYYLKNVNN